MSQKEEEEFSSQASQFQQFQAMQSHKPNCTSTTNGAKTCELVQADNSTHLTQSNIHFQAPGGKDALSPLHSISVMSEEL